MQCRSLRTFRGIIGDTPGIRVRRTHRQYQMALAIRNCSWRHGRNSSWSRCFTPLIASFLQTRKIFSRCDTCSWIRLMMPRELLQMTRERPVQRKETRNEPSRSDHRDHLAPSFSMLPEDHQQDEWAAPSSRVRAPPHPRPMRHCSRHMTQAVGPAPNHPSFGEALPQPQQPICTEHTTSKRRSPLPKHPPCRAPDDSPGPKLPTMKLQDNEWAPVPAQIMIRFSLPTPIHSSVLKSKQGKKCVCVMTYTWTWCACVQEDSM